MWTCMHYLEHVHTPEYSFIEVTMMSAVPTYRNTNSMAIPNFTHHLYITTRPDRGVARVHFFMAEFQHVNCMIYEFGKLRELHAMLVLKLLLRQLHAVQSSPPIAGLPTPNIEGHQKTLNLG